MTLRSTITATLSGVLDLIYPPYCLVCEKAGSDYLCSDCLADVALIEPPMCRRCGTPSERIICVECSSRDFAFERSASVGVYEGPLRAAIHALKFDGHGVVARPLADLMARRFSLTGLMREIDTVVPVPVHRSRIVRRGYNHAEELGRLFCDQTGLGFEPRFLRKRKRTRDQVDLSADRRLENLRGSFVCPRAEPVRGRRVLVIDDIFTTGATLDEAARALRSAGASAVFGFTLARSI